MSIQTLSVPSYFRKYFDNIPETGGCGHECKWIDRKDTNQIFFCSICKRKIKPKHKRWYCEECQTYKCKFCCPPPYIREEQNIVSYNTSIYPCEKGHALKWSTNKNGEEKGFICDICKNVFISWIGRWYCSKCSYNVCAYCTKSLRCHEGFCLLAIDSKPDKYEANFVKCSLCSLEQSFTDGIWRCDNCDFNLCNSCTHKKAVIDMNSKFVNSIGTK